MKLYTKGELIEAIREVSKRGWYSSVKDTIDTRNDGAVGNTLEVLLGLEENNLPFLICGNASLKANGCTRVLWLH